MKKKKKKDERWTKLSGGTGHTEFLFNSFVSTLSPMKFNGIACFLASFEPSGHDQIRSYRWFYAVPLVIMWTKNKFHTIATKWIDANELRRTWFWLEIVLLFQQGGERDVSSQLPLSVIHVVHTFIFSKGKVHKFRLICFSVLVYGHHKLGVAHSKGCSIHCLLYIRIFTSLCRHGMGRELTNKLSLASVPEVNVK